MSVGSANVAYVNFKKEIVEVVRKEIGEEGMRRNAENRGEIRERLVEREFEELW